MKNDSKLRFTGERLVPEIIEYWAIEHLHRYALTLDFIKGKTVVDIASGEGYGTYLMSDHAEQITGIDISEEAVRHAAAKYTTPNLSFKHGSATNMPVASGSVDVLTSFETIEHHDQHEKMMLEVKRVLKPDGLLVISSPDRKFYSDIPGYKNPFHVKELYKNEFVSLVSSVFPHYVLLNQKSVLGSIIVPDNNQAKGVSEYTGDYNEVSLTPGIEASVYNIIIASSMPLSIDAARNSIFHSQHVFDLYIKSRERYDQLALSNQSIVNSSSYKLGRLLTFPLRKIKVALQGSNK